MIKKAIVLGLLVSSLLHAQDGENSQIMSFSLEEAQEYALKSSYKNLDKQLEFEKARQTIKETAAMGLPQITASLDYQWNPQIARQPVPAEFFGGPPGTFQAVAFGVEHQNNATINLNQLLIDGSYFVALQATKVVKETSALQLEKSEIEVRTDVAQSYYGVLVSEKTVEVVEENVTSLKKNLYETRQLFENGFVEEQDVDQLELLVNNLENNLQNAKRQSDLARMTLNFNIGLPINQEIKLETKLDEIIVTEQEIIQQSGVNYDEHIDIRIAESQQKGSELQLANEKAKWYPTLSGFVRHQQTNFQNEFGDVFSTDVFWIPSTSVGVSLSWDILQGLARPAKIQKAKIDRQRTEVALEAASNTVKLQYEQARSNYTFALDNYKNQERNVEISKKIRDRVRIKYKEGISSSLDLTQTENQYLEAQQKYFEALQNLLNSKEALNKAIGK